MLPHGADNAHHGDEEEEDATGGDPADDGQTGDDAGDFTWGKACLSSQNLRYIF